jgi:hypothetical protein
MSWYILRGTSGVGDEPNEENPLSHFGTDMRWEIGYDPKWFTFWARLLDEDPDEDLAPPERRPVPCSRWGWTPTGPLTWPPSTGSLPR